MAMTGGSEEEASSILYWQHFTCVTNTEHFLNKDNDVIITSLSTKKQQDVLEP